MGLGWMTVVHEVIGLARFFARFSLCKNILASLFYDFVCRVSSRNKAFTSMRCDEVKSATGDVVSVLSETS
jgi:hypothetical protein